MAANLLAFSAPPYNFEVSQSELSLTKSETMDLHKLVKNSVKRGLQPKAFSYLFEQLERRQLISGKEFNEYLMKLTHNSNYDHSVQQYLLTVCASSSVRLEQLWVNLSELEALDQKKHLRGIYNLLLLKKPQAVPPELISETINNHFPKYFQALVESNLTTADLLTLASTVWASLVDMYTSLVQTEELKAFVMYIMTHKESLDEEILEYILSKSRPVLQASNVELPDNTSAAHAIVNDNSATNSLIRLLSGLITNTKKNARSFEIKKYLWLLSSMTNWTFNEDNFLNNYEKFCMSKSQNHIVKKSYSLVYDIILSMFNGFATSLVSNEPGFVLFNWNNFIITRLPHILSSVKFLASSDEKGDSNLETLEDAILHGFNALNESTVKAITTLDPKTYSHTDLRQAFIKSCVYSGILATASFHRFFPMEARTTQQMLSHEMHSFSHIESIQKSFDKTLLSVSCEFTSLEESGLFEYIQSLPTLLKYLKAKQNEYSEVLLSIFSQLIENKDSEKLYRLMLSLANNIEAVELFAFSAKRGPLPVLEKVIEFLDNSEWSSDEDNFQESYTFFGVILLGTIGMIRAFNLDLSQILVKTSFTCEYITNFYYRLNDNLSSRESTSTEEEATIVQNYNNLIGDWINALFDDSDEGLPDDLIRAVHVKEIYKLIPIVFQQAVTATVSKTITFDILTNGTDYLSQPFLIPTMLSIIRWLLSRVETSGLDDIYVLALLELIKSNSKFESDDSINESYLIFRGVLKIVGNDIVSTIISFSSWRDNEKAKKLYELVSSNLNDQTTLERREPNLSRTEMGEQLKAAILSVVNGNDAELSRVNLILQRMGMNYLISYLESEISMYKKSVNNSEDIRLFVHLIIFLLVTKAVNIRDDKGILLQILDRKVDKESTLDEYDTSFAPSLEWHYSSIFNSNADQDMDDDLFMENARSSNSGMSLSTILIELSNSTGFLHYLLNSGDSPIQNFLRDFTKDEIKTW